MVESGDMKTSQSGSKADAAGQDSVRVGLGQMLVMPGDYEGNLERARQMASLAVDADCQVLVLPECLDAGWTYPDAGEVATERRGRTTEALAEMASSFGLLVAAGFTERSGEKLYNAAVLVDANGEILAHHRKVNELDFARRLYATGASLSAAEASIGRVGINICADNSSSSHALGQAIALMGARILLSPSSWAVRPDRDVAAEPYEEWVESYGQLARETGMPVVGVSNVGPVTGGEWDGWKCIGSSLAVGADGRVLARAPYGEDAVTMMPVDVPLGRARDEGS